MIWNRIKSAAWHAAYRKLPEGSILEERETPFVEIANNWPYYSVMDPFIFEHCGDTYIFAELYDSLKGRGVIGYSKWTGERFSEWKAVIEENYHLSYPFVYSDKNGEVFIVPESFQNKSVHSYHAISFPEKWERESTLIDNVEYVDTTFLKNKSEVFAFTYDIATAPKKLLLYRIGDGKIVENERKCISQDDGVARPGGRFFEYHGCLIRVSQDCSKSYGSGLVFSEVTPDFWNNYSERQFRVFGVNELWKTSSLKGEGVHTYNATSQFEVIDIKNTCFRPIDIVLRLKRRISALLYRD